MTQAGENANINVIYITVTVQKLVYKISVLLSNTYQTQI